MKQIQIKSVILGALLAVVTMFSIGAVTGTGNKPNWEYKTVLYQGNPDGPVNKLAGEGWTVEHFAATEGNPNVPWFYYLMKRAKP
jgi:hypothetical protein